MLLMPPIFGNSVTDRCVKAFDGYFVKGVVFVYVRKKEGFGH